MRRPLRDESPLINTPTDSGIRTKLSLIQTFIYPMRPHQEQVHRDLSPFRFVLGVPGAGKTYVGLAEALFHSYAIPNNNGLYLTQDMSFTLTALHQIAPSSWLEPAAYRNARFSNTNYAQLSIRSVFGETSRINIWEMHNTLPSYIQSENYGWYVVDDVPWSWNAHYLLTRRLKRQNSLRAGLYLCTGLGFPQWVRQHTCRFSTHFWGESLLVAGQAGNWTDDELRGWIADSLLAHSAPTTEFEENTANIRRRVGEAQAVLWNEGLEEFTQRLASVYSLSDLTEAERAKLFENLFDDTERDPSSNDEADIEAFLEEINNLLDEPDEPLDDEERLPKSAPTG